MKASAISLEKAKNDRLFYFVANVVVCRESDGRVLVLKRSEKETVHPGIYAFPGGKLEWRDLDIAHPTRMNGDVIDFENALEDLLCREVKEEAGIEIDTSSLKYINSVAYVRPDGVPAIMLKFAALALSDEIQLEEGAFSGYQWVNGEEIQKLACIEGVKEEAVQALGLFEVVLASNK